MKIAFYVVALAAVVVSCYEDDVARIVGGTTAKEGDYPFFVNILELDRKTIVAAGTLLKSRVVLTTAYRFIKSYRPYKAEELIVQVGMHKRFEEEPSTQFLYVEEIVTHPRSDPNKYFGDIALLKLSSAPVLNTRVRTFGSKNLVASTEEERRFVQGGGNCVVMGYGAELVFPHIRFDSLDMQQFTPHMRSRKYCETLSPGLMNSRLLCSHNYSPIDRSNVCLSDGGAPLLCTLDGQTKLVGLADAVILEICEGGGTAYTGVANYNEWIIKTAKMLQQDDIEESA